ncbi:hypothetical protein M0638_25900 [Roseomonas sp. NAR14]|uniref:Lectin-like protein BA14k n=1 Tax=Roseomonas acroporae TaxID=2937791 RepID=A0A9X1YCB2_9PROT|nr:hypothetical protein [Roseomonas acroporae]MCK8787794.1 hypothetical protein [Roseomonas acroporae]
MSFRMLAAAIGLAAGLAGGAALASPPNAAMLLPLPAAAGDPGIEAVRWVNRCRTTYVETWRHGRRVMVPRQTCRQVWIGPPHRGPGGPPPRW